MTLTEFLLARIAEDEEWATPQTCVISGGSPAPVVPNCIGPDGRGCPVGWSLGDVREVTAGHREQMRNHSLTHAKRWQRRALAECAVKRVWVSEYERWSAAPGPQAPIIWAAMRGPMHHLAAIYADHPDYNESWRV